MPGGLQISRILRSRRSCRVPLSPFCNEGNQRCWKSHHPAGATWARDGPQLELPRRRGYTLQPVCCWNLSLHPTLKFSSELQSQASRRVARQRGAPSGRLTMRSLFRRCQVPDGRETSIPQLHGCLTHLAPEIPFWLVFTPRCSNAAILSHSVSDVESLIL